MAGFKIVLFEDTAETRSGLVRELDKQLGTDGQVVPFASSKISVDGTYEDRLADLLRVEPYATPTLILADRDLSKSGDAGFPGLSVNAVAAAASQLAVPLCSYAWQARASDDEWFRWEDEHIVLDAAKGETELARQAVVAARGFAQISMVLPGLLHNKKQISPARIMGAVLEKPDTLRQDRTVRSGRSEAPATDVGEKANCYSER